MNAKKNNKCKENIVGRKMIIVHHLPERIDSDHKIHKTHINMLKKISVYFRVNRDTVQISIAMPSSRRDTNINKEH